jgi:demethoxyubiquinone hydroxylase (CLK1/Coq7/Cat5 family)
MEKTVSALKVMQRMERLATNVYRQQIRGFKGEMADTLQKACDNEREHAGTLAGEIRKKGSQPQPIGFLFGMAGGIAGLFTLIIGKKALFNVDTYIEKKAVEDYNKFVANVKFDPETVALLNRIIGDEQRHISNWTGAREALKR